MNNNNNNENIIPTKHKKKEKEVDSFFNGNAAIIKQIRRITSPQYN